MERVGFRYRIAGFALVGVLGVLGLGCQRWMDEQDAMTDGANERYNEHAAERYVQGESLSSEQRQGVMAILWILGAQDPRVCVAPVGQAQPPELTEGCPDPEAVLVYAQDPRNDAES